jgi:hypothetical protein
MMRATWAASTRPWRSAWCSRSSVRTATAMPCVARFGIVRAKISSRISRAKRSRSAKLRGTGSLFTEWRIRPLTSSRAASQLIPPSFSRSSWLRIFRRRSVFTCWYRSLRPRVTPRRASPDAAAEQKPAPVRQCCQSGLQTNTEWPQVNAEKCIDERPLRQCKRVRPTLIAYGVRINPCTTFAGST